MSFHFEFDTALGGDVQKLLLLRSSSLKKITLLVEKRFTFL